MHDSRQQRLVRLLKLRLITVLLLIAAILLLPAVWGAFTKERESRKNNTKAQIQLTQFETQEERLRAEVARLNTERGIEDAFRHQFDVGDAGESVIVIVEKQASSSAVEPVDQNPFSRWIHSWWPRW